MTPQECPDEATLAQLARGELNEPACETVVSHVRECPSCTTTLDELATQESLERFPVLVAALSSRTRDLQRQLLASPPSLAQDGSRSAAIPREIPTIPGLTELEPRSRGGMGIVYQARDIALQRLVAVKVLWPSAAGSQTAWTRAKREALVLARISHANVVAVYTAGATGGSPYLVMEWVDGPSLQQRIAAGLPTPRQAARIVRDLARALDAVHTLGIIHRDIKPDNVLLAGAEAADWDRCVPKLADFGLARPADISQQLTHDAAALGTPAYMAPEQTGLATELGEPGPAADIHGLGGLAFALLTGTPPHEAATAAAALQRAAASEITWPAACRRLPPDLRAIIEKCLERKPARRYASATLLAEDLHRFVEGLPVRARPISPLRRLARTVRRRPVLAAAVGLSLVFATAALGGLAYHAATIAAARSRIAKSERHAEETAGVAARSMNRLTGDLIEQLVRRSRPDDFGHIEFLRQIREEFADWPLGSDPIEALRFRIKGLNRVARLFADVGHEDDALACMEVSLRSLDELADVQPGEPWGINERLASLHIQRAFLYQVGRMEEAISSARQSIAALEAAPADLSDRDRELVRATLDLGMFLSQRQYDEGAAAIEQAVALMRTLRETRPDDVSFAAQEAHALFTAQLCAWNAQQLDDCRRWAERLVTEIGGFLERPKAAASAGPLDDFLTQMVSLGCKRLAVLAEISGQDHDAIRFAQRRKQICLEAVDGLPMGDSATLHNELVDAEIEVAKLLRKAGRGAEAEADLEQAAKTVGLLHAEQPGVWEHAALLALVHQQRAELAADRGDRDAAARWLREVIALMEPQLAKPAREGETEALLADAREGLRRLGNGDDDQIATSEPQAEDCNRP